MAYNVLIVDDSRSMRNVIKKVLRISGFKVGEVFEAGNGREALDQLQDHWVDLILSDVHMPVMDGLEFLRHLSRNEEFRDVPVVLITTEASKKRIQEARDLGARGYLKKPFQPEAIRSLLMEVLGEEDGECGLEENDDGCDF